MKELLIILLVILVLLALTAVRFRRQIMAMLQVWRMLRAMKNAGKTAPDEIPAKPAADQSELVSCARCKTWKPRSESLKFSRGTFYCSTQCVNEAMSVR